MSSTLDKITEEMRARVSGGSGIGGSVKFAFDDDGVIHLDGTEVTNEDKDADCTIRTSVDTFKQIAQGDLDPTMAFMTGKLKIDGDMGLAMKLGPLLQG